MMRHGLRWFQFGFVGLVLSLTISQMAWAQFRDKGERRQGSKDDRGNGGGGGGSQFDSGRGDRGNRDFSPPRRESGNDRHSSGRDFGSEPPRTMPQNVRPSNPSFRSGDGLSFPSNPNGTLGRNFSNNRNAIPPTRSNQSIPGNDQLPGNDQWSSHRIPPSFQRRPADGLPNKQDPLKPNMGSGLSRLPNHPSGQSTSPAAPKPSVGLRNGISRIQPNPGSLPGQNSKPAIPDQKSPLTNPPITRIPSGNTGRIRADKPTDRISKGEPSRSPPNTKNSEAKIDPNSDLPQVAKALPFSRVQGQRPNKNPQAPEISNRPSWMDDSHQHWHRPDWGLGHHNDWESSWYYGGIHPHHHHWYNGCWNRYWGGYWYAPIRWGAYGWGLSGWTTNWSIPVVYYNPYYAVPSNTVWYYDYSQPVIIVQQVDQPAADLGNVPRMAPNAQNGLTAFDQGLNAFQRGDYKRALVRFTEALELRPGDAAIHEVRALTLFALGRYQESAAVLNSLLSSAPGMDWDSMSHLYGKVDQYTIQLRKLEKFCDSHVTDAASHFVLAYHYLVLGEKDSAAAMLEVVVGLQPKDLTARRMLEALQGQEDPNAIGPAILDATNFDPNPTEDRSLASDLELVDPAGRAPLVLLIGDWEAKAGEATIRLSIREDQSFSWIAIEHDKVIAELSGKWTQDANAISLQSDKQGTMAGTAIRIDDAAWQFKVAGAPAKDEGLTFQKLAK